MSVIKTKNEFLNLLKTHLKSVDDKEKENIINYYDELITEKIESGESEENAILKLGSIDDIIKKLNVKETKKIKYEEPIIEKTQVERKAKENKILIIILIILSSPIWISILAGLLGGLIGIVAGFLGICAGILAIPFGAILYVVFGIIKLFTNFEGGLLMIGLGFILIAISVILIPLIIKIIKWLSINIKNLFVFLKKKIGGRI